MKIQMLLTAVSMMVVPLGPIYAATYSPMLTSQNAASQPASAPQTFSFNVAASCTCAQCTFDAQRQLGKFEGVHKVTFSGREHRLDVVFEESKHPVSELAHSFMTMDLGQGSSLMWPAPAGMDRNKAAAALAEIPGVRMAKPDAKKPIVYLTFSGNPAVTLAQLENAAAVSAHGDHGS